MMIWLCLLTLPMSGASRLAASLLGALLGKNCVLSLLTSLPSEGRATLETMAMATQAAMTSQRKRTEDRPSAPKKRSVRLKLQLLLWRARYRRHALQRAPGSGEDPGPKA